VRSRITHQLDLNALRERGHALADAGQIGELATRKFGVKLDAASRNELADVAAEREGGGLRAVETIIKETKRLIASGMTARDAVRRAVDRRAGHRPARRASTPPMPVQAEREGLRATA
jgi:hypothetical protein